MENTYTEKKGNKRQRSLDESSSFRDSMSRSQLTIMPTIYNDKKRPRSPNSGSFSTYKKTKQSSMVYSKYDFHNSMKIITKYRDRDDDKLVKNVKKICYDAKFKNFIDEFLFDSDISKSKLFKDPTPNFYNLLYNNENVQKKQFQHVTNQIYKRKNNELSFIKKQKELNNKDDYKPEVHIHNDKNNDKKKHIYIKSIKILVDVIKDCQEDKYCPLIPTDYNLLFQLHLFIIIRSYECFKNNDIRNLVILSFIMTQFDEQTFSVVYTIENKYLRFIKYFLKSSELHDFYDFKDFNDYVLNIVLMSNTVVKDIINFFVKDIITKSQSLDDEGYIIFNFTKDENTLVIKFPDGWEEKKDDAHEDEKNDNYNRIIINDNEYPDGIGYADYLKLQNNIVKETIDLIFKDINDIFFKKVGGRKKKIQVKNTKHSKIITGPRGGKYMILPNGKKQYLSK